MFFTSAFLAFFFFWAAFHSNTLFSIFFILLYIFFNFLLFFRFFYEKRYFFIHFFLGSGLGVFWIFYLMNLYPLVQEDSGKEKTFNGIVESVSSRSLIIHERSKQFRFRLTGISRETKFLTGDQVKTKCRVYKWHDAPFTERAMRISFYCKNSKLELIQSVGLIQRNATDYFYQKAKRFESSLLRAFITADTSLLPTFYMKRFRKMGIAHLFSASGLHLGLIFAFFFFPFRWLRWEKAGYLTGYIASFLFLLVLGFRTSLLRAFLFLTLFLILKILNRKTPAWFVLTLTAFLIEIFYPLSSFSISFILSFGVTASILFLFPIIRKIFFSYPNWMRDHMSVTFSAFAGSMVFSYLFFDYFHIFQFFWNLILVPLGSLYLLIGLISFGISSLETVIRYMDQFFQLCGEISFLFLENRFDIPSDGMTVTIIIFWIFLLWSYHEILNKKIWFFRHYFIKIIIGFFLSFILTGFYFSYHTHKNSNSEFFVYPYGISIFEESSKALYIYGKKAKFIKEDSYITNKFYNKDLYYNKIILSNLDDYQFELDNIWENSLLYDWVYKKGFQPNVKKLGKGMFLYKGNIILLENHMDPLQWNEKDFIGIKNIYLVLNKKKKSDWKQREWKSFFGIFGFQGNVLPISYFQWIEFRS